MSIIRGEAKRTLKEQKVLKDTASLSLRTRILKFFRRQLLLERDEKAWIFGNVYFNGQKYRNVRNCTILLLRIQ